MFCASFGVQVATNVRVHISGIIIVSLGCVRVVPVAVLTYGLLLGRSSDKRDIKREPATKRYSSPARNEGTSCGS